MKTHNIKAATSTGAREIMSGINANSLNIGDKARVTLSDGTMYAYELIDGAWAREDEFVLKA